MKYSVIFCAACNLEVEANLVKGKDIFGRKGNNKNLFFWECPYCRNHVSARKDESHTPLGTIVGPEVREARMKIHEIADPLWKSGRVKRSSLFQLMSASIGRHINHIGEIRNTREAKGAFECLCTFRDSLASNNVGELA